MFRPGTRQPGRALCRGDGRYRTQAERVPMKVRVNLMKVRVNLSTWEDTMIHRQCPVCGGELVLARRSDEHGAGFGARPSNYWRCSICGGEFSAEQVRENKRSKQFEVARTS
jgi:hypothetical protein